MIGNKKKSISMRGFIVILILALTVTGISALPSSASPEVNGTPASTDSSVSTGSAVATDSAISNGKIAEIEKTSIRGEISFPESISKVRLDVYDMDNYVADDKSTEKREDSKNETIKHMTVKSGTEFEIIGLPEGSYRLEFVCEDDGFDPAFYELDNNVSDQDIAKYQYTEDDPYFLYANVDLKNDVVAGFKINEIEKDAQKNTEESADAKNIVTEGAVDNNTKEAINTDEQNTGTSEENKDLEKEATDTSVTAEDLGIKAPSVNELKTNSKNVVGATESQSGLLGNLMNSIKSLVTGSDWAFDVYYVGEKDKNYVEKTDDFNLKYQMEFHNSTDLKANDVEIRMPIDTFKDREGNLIIPTDFAIPMGTPGNSVETSVSPFNYYVDGNELVFFNYKDIVSGSNVAWQVMYKNIKVMEIKDETRWSLDPVITVNVNGNAETKTPKPLTGRVNTAVNLEAVTKKADTLSGKSYGPGLYTQSQVEKYTGPLTGEYKDNFDDYVYVLWNVSVTGNASQPWNLLLKDETDRNGTVIGIKDNSSGSNLTISAPANGYQTAAKKQKEKTIKKTKTGTQDHTYSVVTAYPKSQVTPGALVTNKITAQLQPFDQVDPNQEKSAEDSWSYKEYNWVYSGDVVGIHKYTPQTSISGKTDQMKGWLTVYEGYQAANKDKGNFTYNTTGILRSYSQTHYITGPSIGKKIPNTTATSETVDDLLYAHSSSDASNPVMMTDKDYYFNGVTISINEKGYDIWEDEATAPEKCGDAKIYVMYKGSTDWELIHTVPWSSDIKYTLSSAELEKQPWRVKVVHETTNYVSDTNIKVSVAIRPDSPVFEKLMQDNPKSITVQNVSGIMAYRDNDTQPRKYLHDRTSSNYQQYPRELIDFTYGLYGMLIMRDSAQIDVTYLEEMSDCNKTAKVSNDVINGRVDVRYNLTAHDGYEIYGNDGVSDLNVYREDIISPSRNEVMFYDLLPYGVQFDPSKPVTAGRTTDMTMSTYGKYTEQPAMWDGTQVQVAVDKIITDYKGTGRTYVAFKITYSGADSSYYTPSKRAWLEGWGVSFGAYYNWKNIEIVDKVPNITAFMAASDDDRPLLGKPSKDNGVYPEGLEKIYKDFGSDINDNGRTDDTVLYANSTAYDDIVVASESKIEKLVKADSDKYADFSRQTAVNGGSGYTYDITIHNATGNVKDIVVFDRIENAIKDRQSEEPGYFDSGSWNGTFNGLQLRNLDELGIDYTVYYNAGRDAAIPTGNQLPSSVLTTANGWYKADTFPGALKDVKAFAVDISKTKTNTGFVLSALENISFQVKMTAPLNSEWTWTYNNPSFYRYSVTNNEGHTVIGNSTKVRLNDAKTLEVTKSLAEGTPEQLKNTEFEFVIKRDGQPLRNMEYKLYDNVNGSWVESNKIHATDSNGIFYLTAAQKAVFKDLVAVKEVTVEESDNPFWESKMTKDDSKLESEDLSSINFTNKYRPVLFATKEVTNVPSGLDVSGDVFTFKLLVDGKAAANQTFCYVDSVRTDGGIPNIIKKGTTDANGEFKIKAGEIVALFPGDEGTKYTVTEVGGIGDGDRWFTDNDTVNGVLALRGSVAAITNNYKYKTLLLTKEITNQDPANASQAAFKFRVTDEDNKPVTGNSWVVLDSHGIETAEKGILDSNGEFACKAGGKTVKIKDLIAGRTYIIEEIESGALYEAVNDGIVQVTMPKYGDNKTATITNDYLKRPLSVTKHVLYDMQDKDKEKDVADRSFTMTVKVGGELLANTPYDVYENGKKVGSGATTDQGTFTIKNGQTVTFPEVAMKDSTYEVTESQDADYPQVYPANQQAQTGKLSMPKNDVSFINGEDGKLILEKHCVNGDGSPEVASHLSEAYMSGIKPFYMTLDVTEGNETYTYPKADKEVLCINNDGTTFTKTWKAGKPVLITAGMKIIVDDLPADAEYKLSETEATRNYIDKTSYGYIQIQQTIPADFGSVTGTVEKDPVAQITNSLSLIKTDGSEINKTMKAGSTKVPEGSVLTWKVEEFNGTNWVAKEGVPYYSFDSKGITCNEKLYTDSKGYIVLKKTANGFPYVKFEKDEVKLNVTEGTKGDLRVIEIMSESDDAWGYLSAYADSKKNSITLKGGNTFINSNLPATVEIAKNYEGTENDTFTFILEQILSTRDPMYSEFDILASEAHGGIAYTIYDQKTNEAVGVGETTAKGEIFIKGGQYVKIDLPNDTYWTIREKVMKPYSIKSLEVKGSDIYRFDYNDNLAIIHPIAQIKAKPITLTREMVLDGVINADTYQRVNLSSGNVVIPEYIVYEGELRVITATENGTGTGLYDRQGVFSGMNINSFVLPDTLKTIGSYTFADVKPLSGTLKMPVIPDGVVTIGDSAFVTNVWDKPWQGTLNLGSGVETIGISAFDNCTQLTGSLILPSSLKTIGKNAFYYCIGFTGNLTIPDNVTTIGESAFSDCTGFTGTLSIGKSVTEIGNYAFVRDKFKGSLTFPDSLQTIGDGAFGYCTGFTGNLTIGKNVTYIGATSFLACSGFNGKLTLGQNVETIGQNAFTQCTKLNGSLIIPDSVKTIGYGAFGSDTGFTSLTIGQNVEIIDGYAFGGCVGMTGNLVIPDSVTIIGDSAFNQIKGFTKLTLGSGVTKIGQNAFSNCGGLSGNLVIPDNVETIGFGAFAGCINIGSVVQIGSGIKTIEQYAFRFDTKITIININRPPGSVDGAPWEATNATVNWQ